MDIRQYVHFFKRWGWLLMLITILGVFAGFAYSRYQKPVYHSETMILVMQNEDNNVPNAIQVNDKQIGLTFTELLSTQPVIQATSARLGYEVLPQQIEVSQVIGSDLIQISVEDGDPQHTADIANTLVTVFIEQYKDVQSSRFVSDEESLQAQIQDVDGKISTLQQQIAQQSQDIYKQQIDEVSKSIANIQSEMNTLNQDVVRLNYTINPPVQRYYDPTPTVEQKLELAQKQNRMKELESLLAMYQRIYVDLSYNPQSNNELNPNTNIAQIGATLEQYQQIYSNLVANLESIRLARMRSTPNIVQVDNAIPAAAPIRPNQAINMTVGGIIGLLIAAGFSFVSEYMDDTLRTPEEVSEIFDLPVLGYIGNMDHLVLPENDRKQLPFVLAQPRSPVSEAFRSLRANLDYIDLPGEVHTLAITSSSINEGKTTIATNLAIVMAQLGRKVVLIDADLRRPRVHRALGITNVMGLSDVLRGHATIQDVAQPWDGGNLVIITSGSLPPNPAEILSSTRMMEVIETLKKDFEMIIIDTPPSLLADSVVLAARADGVLLVIQSNKTHLNTANAMIEQLKRVGANVVGIALNRINVREPSYYYNNLKDYTSYAYDVEHNTQPGAKKRP